MNNVYLERDYKWYTTVLIPDIVTWEFELSLDRETNSSMWYLLIEPWTVREETIFYHRSSGNTVWFYQVNRTWTFEHADNSQILLVNSIDYMNYILWQTNEQLFLYKISDTDLVIKGWKFYIASQTVILSDLDTSLDEEWKTLFNDSVNYIYIDTENLDFLITNEVNNNYYLVATVLTNAWWVIQSITKEKTLHIGTIGETWDPWEQWPLWPKGDPWNPWVDWAEVEIRNNWTYIQWKYDNETDSSWRNIISISDITWVDWDDWREVEISKQVNEWQEAISYRYVWSSTWIPIVYLSDIIWETWNWIDNISLLSTVWKVKTYRITFTDSTTYDYIVTDWNDWDISESTQKNVNDKQTIDWTIVTDDIEKTITSTNTDWTKIEYNEQWIFFYDSNWELIWKIDKIWTYDNWIITTEDWDVINWNTWETNINEWNIAYLNKDNIFQNVNTFNSNSVFKWNCSFPYSRIDMTGQSTILFNANNGTKQRTINLTWWWSKNLSFSNLYAWANYELCIRIADSNNITINKWTATLADWTSINFYSIWWTEYPLTLSADDWWIHIFVMDVFDTWIHISYIWQSKAIPNP